MMATGKYLAKATARLQTKLVRDNHKMTRRQIVSKWDALVRKGVVQPITATGTSHADSTAADIFTPTILPTASTVTPPCPPAATCNRKKWSVSDTTLFREVMEGLLQSKPVPSNIFEHAAKQLSGRLSVSRSAKQLSERWRRVSCPLINKQVSADDMNAAQKVKWRRASRKARLEGSRPAFTTLGDSLGVKPNDLRRMWEQSQATHNESTQASTGTLLCVHVYCICI